MPAEVSCVNWTLVTARFAAPQSICAGIHARARAHAQVHADSVVTTCMQLEVLADASFVVVVILVCVVIVNALHYGLPALHDGSFALTSFHSFGELAVVDLKANCMCFTFSAQCLCPELELRLIVRLHAASSSRLLRPSQSP